MISSGIEVLISIINVLEIRKLIRKKMGKES